MGSKLATHQRAAGDQPWRAFIRGFFLLMMYTRPRRRTTRQFLSRTFAALRLLRMRMTQGFRRNSGRRWIGAPWVSVKRTQAPETRSPLDDNAAPSAGDEARRWSRCTPQDSQPLRRLALSGNGPGQSCSSTPLLSWTQFGEPMRPSRSSCVSMKSMCFSSSRRMWENRSRLGKSRTLSQ